MQRETITGFRLSPQQTRLWGLQQAEGADAFRAQCAVLVEGHLKLEALSAAVRRVVERNEILRTTFHYAPGMKTPVQVVNGANVPPLREYDLGGFSGAERERRLEQLLLEERERPLGLEQSLLLHASVVRVSASEHVLILNLPALCADAESLKTLVREVSRAYEECAGGTSASDAPMQYADLAEWQNELLEAEDTQAGRAFWQRRGAGHPPDLKLPFGKPHNARSPFAPRAFSLHVGSDALTKLQTLGHEHQTTTALILLACWHILLWRLSGQAHLAVGAAYDGRTDEELADTLGLLTKYLPIQSRLDGEARLSEVLRQLTRANDENSTWQTSYCWEHAEGANNGDALSGNNGDDLAGNGDAPPRFLPVAFDFNRQPAPSVAGTLSFKLLRQYACVERFNVKLSCQESESSLITEFHYDASLFSVAEIERLAHRYHKLLESVARQPDAAIGSWEIVPASELRQLIVEFNTTGADYPRDACIHQLFERHAERAPDQIAVVFDDERLTYGELNRRANQLAHHLQHLGAGAEVLVGLFLERSPQIVVALLGVLKAGAAYVPLDPAYPLDRLGSMLDDAQVPIIITQEHLLDLLPSYWAQTLCIDSDWEMIEGESDENPPGEATAENTAYVIYTSGTTGQPKGVMIEHGGVANLAAWQADNFRLTPASRISQFASYSFDAAVGESFMALLNGATLVMLSRDHLEPERLMRAINEHRISVCVLVPSMLKELDPALLRHGDELTIVAVGEACPPDLARRWSKFCTFMNAYGPTEYTVYSHLWKVSDADAYENDNVPIGTPIHNAKSYILDAHLNPVPIGVVGDIYISGPGIARGYLRQPDLTAEKFIPNRFAGETLFNDRGLLESESAEAERQEFRSRILLRRDGNSHREHGQIDMSSERIFELVKQLDTDLIERTHAFVRDYCQKVAVYQAFCRYLCEGVNGSYASYGINREVLGALLPFEDFGGLEGVDFGFGNGEIMQTLVGMGARMKGLDFNPFFVQKGRGNGLCVRQAKIDVAPEMFAGESEFAAGSQDFAISTLLLDRLERPKASLQNLFLILKEGGRFAVQTLLPIVGMDDGDVDDPIVYTPEPHRIAPGINADEDKLSLVSLLRECGARDIEIYRLPYTVSSGDGVQDYTMWSFVGRKGAAEGARGTGYERMYRTGDVGLYLPDGNLEFRGRVDNQIKIRGFRIELGDIEAALSSHPQIKDSVVVASENERGAKRLHAYFVAAAPAHAPANGELQSFLKAKLPDYMIPAVFVRLDDMPLTPNGKIDRRALPEAGQAQPQATGEFVAPQTPVEEVLANLWAEILGIERVGIHDNFFELGGHSLLGTQVVSHMREIFRQEFLLRNLFERPTVSELAKMVEAALRDGRELDFPPIKRVSREAELPVSYSQQRQWILDQFDPGSADYNLPTPVRLRGRLDIAALQQTLGEIIRRHESLRTTFAAGESGTVQVINPASPVSLEVVDVSELPETEREERASELIAAEAKQPFDLARGPLVRAGLLRLSEEDHVLTLTMHHIVNDGWSQGILIREIATLYEAFAHGRPSPLAELEIQYADYAHWQRRWLQGEVLDEQLAYWKQKLAGVPVLQLPTDRARPPIQTFAGAAEALVLSRELTARLKELSRREGSTLFMALLSIYKLMLSRYSGQQDVCVGTFIANRNRVEVENLVGFFVNNLSLRSDLSGDPSYRELLRRVRDVTLAAYAHQDVPFEKVLDELQPERDLSRTPLFQVMFVLQNAPTGALDVPGLSIIPLGAGSNRSNFDMTLWMLEVDGELVGDLQYNTDLFNAATVERMARSFEALVEELLDQPDERLSQLSLLTSGERRRLLSEWNQTTVDYPQTSCIHELFEAWAARTPDAPAVAFEGGELTYRELNARANQLAHRLRASGIGAESLVALCVERSVEMVVGILGVLKAGGGYVPLDPDYPAQRISFMLEDARASVLLTQRRLAGSLPHGAAEVICLDSDWGAIAGESEENLSSGATPENLAYVIYTSGSTGRPKGVLITHRNVINHSWAIATRLDFTAADRILQFHSISFDGAVEEYFPIWFSGGTLFLPAERLLVPDDSFLRLIERQRLTALSFPIPYWHEWVNQLSLSTRGLPDCLRLVIVGAERTSIEHFQTWQKRFGDDVRWVNTYGPTETTVSATLYELPDSMEERLALAEVPIGRPIANARAFILDAHLQPVPIGAVGELLLGGDGVARGYLDRPEQTAEKFIPDPHGAEPGARLYRTGDLARYRADGQLEFVGRNDHQVKVRGFRIELGEIETALGKYPGIAQTLVVVREDAPGEKRVAAYLVSDAQPAPTTESLRAYLKERLPEYMIPASFVMLDALPLTPNGKVDRGALPAPDHALAASNASYLPPRNAAEEQLARIWAEVLGVEKIGVNDNFFELGGDSILSIQVVARANGSGLQITPKQIFEHRTVAGLATVAGTAPVIRTEQGVVAGVVPLTPIQHWFFEQDLPEAHHWNMSVMLQVNEPLDPPRLKEAVRQTLLHHDALRLRFTREPDAGWRQFNAAPDDDVPFAFVNMEDVPETELSAAIEAAATARQSSLNLSAGPLLDVTLFGTGEGRRARLLIAAHHLVIDGVSWRIILEDLQLAYTQLSHGEAVRLPPKTTSFKQWSELLSEYAQADALSRELPYWLAGRGQQIARLPVDERDAVNTEASARNVVVKLGAEETHALLHEISTVYHTQINDLLLAAFALTLAEWAGGASVLIDLEGHGREDVLENVNISRTVGWFTTISPLVLEVSEANDHDAIIKSVKEQLRRIPQRGIGYGLLRYLNLDAEVRRELQSRPQAEISFNYLGQFNVGSAQETSLFSLTNESRGPVHSLRGTRRYLIEVVGMVSEGELQLDWTYSADVHRQSTIERLAQAYLESLRRLIRHCQTPDAGGFTPSDFPLARLDAEKFEKLAALFGTDDFE
ncbi:MAG TPA: amino acid adenylation domain-containing protein [Pyrinomonadaceae bacterium]|nr:amino acid adenylation domain-containing protein [Pyrinomonadaceae bacterium]